MNKAGNMQDASRIADQKLTDQKLKMEEDFRRSKEQGVCQSCGSSLNKFTASNPEPHGDEPDFL